MCQYIIHFYVIIPLDIASGIFFNYRNIVKYKDLILFVHKYIFIRTFIYFGTKLLIKDVRFNSKN
jgi:hypothetical protein